MWWCLPSPRRHRPTLRNGRTARRSIAHQRSGRCLCRWSQVWPPQGRRPDSRRSLWPARCHPGHAGSPPRSATLQSGWSTTGRRRWCPGFAVTLVTAPAPARAALIPGVVWPAVTLTAVAVPAAGWLFQHWSTYPAASEDPPMAPEAWKHTTYAVPAGKPGTKWLPSVEVGTSAWLRVEGEDT